MNPPSAPPAGSPPKNGPSGLAIFGFGCLGLAILVGIGGAVVAYKGWQKAKEIYAEAGGDPAKVAARMMIKMNPDLELVSTDDAKGQMTIRDKKSGEVITLAIDDVAKGKFSVKGADGSETTIDVSQGSGGRMTVKDADGKTTLVTGGTNAPLPGWVPVYPGGETLPGGLHSETAEGIAAPFSCARPIPWRRPGTPSRPSGRPPVIRPRRPPCRPRAVTWRPFRDAKRAVNSPCKP